MNDCIDRQTANDSFEWEEMKLVQKELSHPVLFSREVFIILNAVGIWVFPHMARQAWVGYGDTSQAPENNKAVKAIDFGKSWVFGKCFITIIQLFVLFLTGFALGFIDSFLLKVIFISIEYFYQLLLCHILPVILLGDLTCSLIDKCPHLIMFSFTTLIRLSMVYMQSGYRNRSENRQFYTDHRSLLL